MKIFTNKKWAKLQHEWERKVLFYQTYITDSKLLAVAESFCGPMPHGITQWGLADLIKYKMTEKRLKIEEYICPECGSRNVSPRIEHETLNEFYECFDCGCIYR